VAPESAKELKLRDEKEIVWVTGQDDPVLIVVDTMAVPTGGTQSGSETSQTTPYVKMKVPERGLQSVKLAAWI